MRSRSASKFALALFFLVCGTRGAMAAYPVDDCPSDWTSGTYSCNSVCAVSGTDWICDGFGSSNDKIWVVTGSSTDSFAFGAVGATKFCCIETTPGHLEVSTVAGADDIYLNYYQDLDQRRFWQGTSEVDAGNGNDTIDGSSYNCGGGVCDWIKVGYGADTAYGRDGVDYIEAPDDDTSSNTLKGGPDADWIYGGEGNDIIQGQDGADWLFGGDGADLISGGEGGDSIYGEDGADTLYGDEDNDFVYGAAGNDYLWGGSNDSMVASGNDYLMGGDGDDYLYGEDGTDTIKGGDDEDRIWGGDGVDSINAGADYDAVYGGLGDDYICGGFYEGDVIYGEGGTDTCYDDYDNRYTCEATSGANDGDCPLLPP